MRNIAGLLLLCSPVFAQFQGFSTTDDGAHLWFSTSLTIRDSGQLTTPKLFERDLNGMRLVAQRAKQDGDVVNGYRLSNYYALEGAQASGDGTVLAIIARRDCVTSGSGCFVGIPKYHSEISGIPGKSTIAVGGQVRLSGNGRYALSFCDGSMIGMGELTDLYTGQSLTIPNAACTMPSRRVASTGIALMTGDQQLLLIGLSGTRTVSIPDQASEAVIDDSAAVAAYSTIEGKLVRVSLDSGTASTLATGKSLRVVSISTDGTRVAYLANDSAGLAQLYEVRNGSAPRQVTQDAAGIADAVVSGNGSVAYVRTLAGRVLMVDVAAAKAAEVVGQTPLLSSIDTAHPVAGSAFCLQGAGFAASSQYAAAPLPAKLAGLRVFFGDEALPVQAATPARACVQMPWDATGSRDLRVAIDSEPLFAGGETYNMSVSADPVSHFVRMGNFAQVAHGDFRGAVLPSDPAEPGEVVHFYMTGLGPVSPTVETGAPSPADPPAVAVTPLTCTWSVAGHPNVAASVLWAGLAPGFAGYYQVSVRIPDDVPMANGETTLDCHSGSVTYEQDFGTFAIGEKKEGTSRGNSRGVPRSGIGLY